MNYENSKTSIHVENQFPFFVKNEGERFVEFMRTYYDWLEKRVVILVLKSEYPIEENDIKIGEVLDTSFYSLIDETEDFIIVSEDTNMSVIFENNFSLRFDGENDHMDVSNSIFDITDDWSISLWFRANEYPSVSRTDFDILTLSNSGYLSLANLSEDSNKLTANIDGNTIKTDIIIKKDEWYLLNIRYDSSNKKLFYDVIDNISQYSYNTSIDLSSTVTNRFVLGCDLYNSRNFFNGNIDEVSVWDSFISDDEIISIYNDGTTIDLTLNNGDYASNTNLINYYRFEDSNTTVATNEINTSYNGNLYNNPLYEFDVPYNISALITEDRENYSLSVNVLSYIRYDGGEEGVMSNRLLVFAEHLYGKLETNVVIKSTPTNTIVISDFIEAKNPLNAINNIQNYQNIDYVFDYNNFVSNDYFQYLWKEIMFGFPLFLSPKHDEVIKSLLSKNIKELYKSKGTFKAIKKLFKLIYNEDLEIGTDIYSDNIYSYVVKTNNYGSSDVEEFMKNICHPVGYNLQLQPK